jgi:hypothetical protein
MRFALLVLLVACDRGAPSTPGSEPPPPPPLPTPDELIHQAIDQPPDDRAYVVTVLATNVRAGGELDPNTGHILIGFNRIPDGTEPGVQCPAIVMHANSAPDSHDYSVTCLNSEPVLRVNCTLAAVWRRAIANGASPDRPATIAIGAPTSTARLAESVRNGSDVGPLWAFVTDDNAEAYIPDDCATR